jgi:hypothetical protein
MTNGKQVAVSDLHLNCAEVKGAREPLRRGQPLASLGTKYGASQEDKGVENVKPR